VGWRQELLLLGEPTERAANVEEVTRREVRELLVGSDDEDDWSDLAGGEAGPDDDDERAAG
jgi:hypothetical protein